MKGKLAFFNLSARSAKRGFTLVELLLSMGILAVLLLLIVQVTSQTSSVWRRTTARADQFREARDAFESITRNLSQATLNTYYEYYNSAGQARGDVDALTDFTPASYGRYSELRFVSGNAATLLGGNGETFPTHAIFFQAPLGFTESAGYSGLHNLLNTWGYYIQFRPDTDKPDYITGTTRYRYRLMEFMQPSEELNIYEDPDDWIESANGGTKSHVIASNIIALVILPKLPTQGPANDPTVDPDGNKLAPEYEYDSTTVGQGAEGPEYNSLHQLPPVVEVTMIAIDEASASNLEQINGTSAPNLGLNALFDSAGTPEQRRDELEGLVGYLASQKISYRVFSTEVSIRGAKWSREQIAF